MNDEDLENHPSFQDAETPSASETDDSTVDDGKTARNAVAYVGFSFFVLFSGHAVFRSLLPAWKPQSGPLLVAASFFAYAIGSLVHPRFIRNYRRQCFVFGALAQAQWIGMLQLPVENPAFPAVSTLSSFLNGLGAGLLWSTEGGWMSSICSLKNPHQAQYYTGMFLSFYGASGFLGNIAAALTLAFASTSISIVVWCLFGIACAGGLFMIFAPSRYFYPPTATDRAIPQSSLNIFQLTSGTSKRFHQFAADSEASRILTIKSLFRETVFSRTIPAIMALSFVSAFAWVVIPTLCASAFQVDGDLPVYLVPTLFSLYAFANAFGAPLSSSFIRKTSVSTVFSIASIFIALPIMLYFTAAEISGKDSIYGLAVSTFLCGVVVGTYNNCLYALYATKITMETAKETTLPKENYPHLIGEAYCWHGFIYCMFFTIFSSVTAVTPARWLALVAAISTILGTISFLIKRV